MRLWSIHPKYLDRQGLLACWREGLLAQNVLLGNTKGYKNHPQLIRFKKDTLNNTMEHIGQYLYNIWFEAHKRGYNFNIDKIESLNIHLKINVTQGQIEYEFEHLQKKLWTRNIEKRTENCKMRFYDFEGFAEKEKIQPHPLFNVVEGEIEKWEKIK